jgi:transcriptional regulator GlxA family with amidase domain
MHIAILTFEGFNELDSLIALGVLNRAAPKLRVSLATPTPQVTSMNGVTLQGHITLEDAAGADAVLVGSGIQTRTIIQDAAMMARLQLDPARQLIAAQCSGALILAKLGLLSHGEACTDLTTAPWLQALGIRPLQTPLHVQGSIATAGGCLASVYLAGWLISRLIDEPATAAALHYMAPVGEKESYVAHALALLRQADAGQQVVS